MASSATRCSLTGVRCTAWISVLGGMHQRVVAARTKQRKASARNAAAGEIDIVVHRQAGEQRGNLVGAAQAAADALVGRKVGDVLAEEADGAGGRREIAGDAVEQRGLARAVRAEHRAPLAGPHRHGHVGQRGERAEQPGDAPQLQRRAGADGGQALRDAIHGRGLPVPHCAADRPRLRHASTGRSRRPATRTR